MAWKCTSIIPPDHLFWIWHLHFLQDLEKAASQLSVSVLRAERNSRLVKPCNLCPLPMSEHPYRCHYWLPNQFRQHYWTWMCQRYLATRCEYYFILFQYCFSYLAQYFLRRRDEYSIYNPGPQWRMMYCNSLKKKSGQHCWLSFKRPWFQAAKKCQPSCWAILLWKLWSLSNEPGYFRVVPNTPGPRGVNLWPFKWGIWWLPMITQ